MHFDLIGWFRQKSTRVALTLGAIFIMAAEAWLLQQTYAGSKLSLRELVQKQQERDRLIQQSPALDEDNSQAILNDLGQLQAKLEMGQQMRGDRSVAESPANPSDLFFELSDFTEQMRMQAEKAHVTINLKQRFGFAAYANAGPQIEKVVSVFHQRRALADLLRALFDAQPQSLLCVQREVPGVHAKNSDAAGSSSSPDEVTSTDYFAFNAGDRVRASGATQSDLFRFEFAGQTPALRRFLNRLALAEPLTIVRRVEVDSLAPELPAAATIPADNGVPFMAPASSKFTVVVEAVRLLTGKEVRP